MKTKQQKRIEAEERNAAWAEMPLQDKIKSLYDRGHKHCKQFDKLCAIKHHEFDANKKGE